VRLLALCLLAWTAAGQEVKVTVTPSNPVVGDEIRVEVQLTAAMGVRVDMPQDPGPVDCAQVLDREFPSPVTKGVRTTYRTVFVLDPMDAGTCHLRPMAAEVGDAIISSHPVEFNIASMIPPGETAPDIRDGQEPLEVTEPALNWTVAVIGLVILLVVIGWFTFSGRKPEKEVVRYETPEARARRRLAQLAAQTPALPAREFYAELSRILSAYLDERLALRASRCTSPEMMSAVQRTGLLTYEGRDLLEALLEDCDCAKFAPDGALSGHPGEALACCQKIIAGLSAQAATRSRLAHAARETTHA